MAQQQRAARTRATIVRAAAEVFGDIGYEAATISDILKTAGVTKGALYFHFGSKQELAQEVLDVQISAIPQPPSQTLGLQVMLDQGMLMAHLLAHDPLVRGSVRLTTERASRGGPDRRVPYRRWTEVAQVQLELAGTHGELLPHVEPQPTAELIVGAFAGIQGMSQAFSDYADLGERTSALYHSILPTIAVPAVLGRLDMAPDRGSRVMAAIDAREAEKAREAEERETEEREAEEDPDALRERGAAYAPEDHRPDPAPEEPPGPHGPSGAAGAAGAAPQSAEDGAFRRPARQV